MQTNEGLVKSQLFQAVASRDLLDHVMNAARAIVATTVASFLTVFAVIGMARVVEVVLMPTEPGPIAVSRQRIDFGTLPLHGSVTRQLVVRNQADGPLHARFLVGGAAYTVDPPEMILQPGVESTIEVIANADQPGRFDAVLSIYFDGGQFEPVLIRLAAEVEADPPPATTRV